MTSKFEQFCDWLGVTDYAEERAVWAREAHVELPRETYDQAPEQFAYRHLFAKNAAHLFQPTEGIHREMPVIWHAHRDEKRLEMRRRADELRLRSCDKNNRPVR